MFHYLKFFHFYLVALISVMFIFLGGHFIWLGLLFVNSLYVFGDYLVGDDLSNPTLSNTKILNALLYAALPLSLLIFAVNMYLVSPYHSPLNDMLNGYFQFDITQYKSPSTWWQIGINVVFSGFLFGSTAIVVAHELVHRLKSKSSVCLGRWLLSFCFDANFSIEHVYHHHANVATPDDASTAPRGRNVYSHITRALLLTNQSSWKIEAKRLGKNNLSVYGMHNRCIRGYLMSLCWVGAAYLLASWQGAIYFIAIGAVGKLSLEIVNYIEHYGLVRDPKHRVMPRHSWNTNRKFSCWGLFNLPRHSHHHAQASTPYHQLNAMDDAPKMLSGYLSTMILAMIPPLWFRLMTPKLKRWDEHFASPEELSIIAQQNTARPRGLVAQLLY